MRYNEYRRTVGVIVCWNVWSCYHYTNSFQVGLAQISCSRGSASCKLITFSPVCIVSFVNIVYQFHH